MDLATIGFVIVHNLLLCWLVIRHGYAAQFDMRWLNLRMRVQPPPALPDA